MNPILAIAVFLQGAAILFVTAVNFRLKAEIIEREKPSGRAYACVSMSKDNPRTNALETYMGSSTMLPMRIFPVNSIWRCDPVEFSGPQPTREFLFQVPDK